MSGAASLRTTAATGVRWTFVATVVSTAAQMTQLVVLGRLLSPEAFGLMAMVLVILGIMQAYADLGLSSALVYRTDATREQLSSLYWLNVLAGVTVFVGTVAAAPWLVYAFDEPAVVPLLRVAAVTLLIAGTTRQFEVLLQRDLSFRTLAIQDVGAAIVGTTVGVALATAGAGAWALVGAAIATSAVKGAGLIVVGLRRYRPGLRLHLPDVRSFLGFGMFQVGERTVNYVGERVDQFLVGSMIGAVGLGLYGFSFTLVSQPVSRVNPVVTKVAYPTLARVVHEPARLRRAFLAMCRLLASVNAPLLLGFAATAPIIVPAVFGAKWQAAVPVAQVLALVALSRSIGNPIGSLQLAKGRADLGFKWNVLLLAVAVPATYAGARAGGLLGIAYALLALQIVLQLLGYRLLIRPLLGRCGRAYAVAVLRPVAHAFMACIVAGLAPLLRPHMPPLAAGATLIGVGMLVYAASLLLLERPMLREMQGLVLARS